jgi:rRNA-processing protein FCF1
MATNRLRHSQIAKTRRSRVLLDASFIMQIFEKPLKAFDRVEETLGRTDFVVTDDVLKELKVLVSSRSMKKQKIALQALRYAEKLPRVRHTSSGLTVDERIVDHAWHEDLAVATMDAELRRRLRRTGITVVTCRKNEVIVL